MTAAVALATPPDCQIAVDSDPLGNFAVAQEDTFEFPQGILGFPGCHRFALVRTGKESMYWLQSLDYRALVFLLVDPFMHFPDYAVDVTSIDRASLKVKDPADLALLAIVTLPAPQTGAYPTVNLQGPIAVNLKGRVGRQLVCGEGEHGVRRELRLDCLGG